MLNLIKVYLPGLYLIQLATATGKSLGETRIEEFKIFLEITPTSTNLLETLAKFGKEYKVSLEFKADSIGGQWYNILEIGDREVGVWLDQNSKVFVESKVSGSGLQTRINGISTGTWYKLEITQSLIEDKVPI